MATDIKLTSQSELKIKEVKNIDPVGIHINEVNQIAPVAVHLKEVNHIDPITIDDLHISEVKNIDPLNIASFNVTKLPMVNVSLQKLPALDVNLRNLPPISVGTHQTFSIPSNYTLRARFLGIELVRLNLEGKTSILPRQRIPVERYKDFNKSYSETRLATEPAAPVKCAHTTTRVKTRCVQHTHSHPPQAHHSGGASKASCQHHPISKGSSLSFGTPSASFKLHDEPVKSNLSENRITSGD